MLESSRPPSAASEPRGPRFCASHWGAIAATDFFTVEVLTMHGLVRYSVLFVIDLKTRFVHVAGIAHDPYGAWMEQIARNLTDTVDGFLKNTRYLIHDRDPLFTQRFTEILGATGTKTVKLPPRSPDLNAFAERFLALGTHGVSASGDPPRRETPTDNPSRIPRPLSSRTKQAKA